MDAAHPDRLREIARALEVEGKLEDAEDVRVAAEVLDVAQAICRGYEHDLDDAREEIENLREIIDGSINSG